MSLGLCKVMPKRLCATFSKIFSELAGSLSIDFHLPFEQRWSGIQTLIHLHQRDTSVLVAFKNGPLDRCRSTPAGKERSMNIDAA